jgi:hypothetical protein
VAPPASSPSASAVCSGRDSSPRDLDLLGFDAGEIERLLALVDAETDDPDEDDVPEAPEEPTTKPGDLWTMGPHRLLCGDATGTEDVARLMDGQLADMAGPTRPTMSTTRGPQARSRMMLWASSLGRSSRPRAAICSRSPRVRSMSRATGFMVGFRALRDGLSNHHTSPWSRAPHQ